MNRGRNNAGPDDEMEICGRASVADLLLPAERSRIAAVAAGSCTSFGM
ncbi:MAG: hypothetical protein JSV80_16715 [Acidobacteriota bacterium]|nr:MAG: hypothetical protein JSV80_16715 [Acidobacteriota bacterium]